MKPRKAAAGRKRYFIIDFDSTFIRDEAMEVLAGIALAGHPRKNQILEKIAGITKAGMEGRLSFSESLEKRLALFSANSAHLKETALVLKSRITPSIERNRDFFKNNRERVYLVSGGFREYILPIAREFGILPGHVLANSFRLGRNGAVTGIDRKNPLAQNGGKARAVAALKLEGDVVVVGDGITDYEIRERHSASTFFAFVENVARPSVVEKADRVVRSFDELLYHYGLPRAVFYPHGRLKVLLLEKIHPLAEANFTQLGYRLKIIPEALSEAALIEEMPDVAILGIRSGTHITKRVLDAAPRLLAIGAFCIGTNQIDLRTAAQKGIAVFNAPYANGRSVSELAMGLIVALSRRIGDHNTNLHRGIWNKSAKDSREIRGKTLGIVGYGNIGSQLSVIAEGMGMQVCFHDVFDRPMIGNARRTTSLQELLERSDVVTLHVDGRPQNRNLFGDHEFAAMREGALFLNLSRGSVVDVAALARALERGHLGGAALDVFPDEPRSSSSDFRSPLQGLSNVILTPHIGGSTEEAQETIARYLSTKLMNFIDTGDTALSVNFPNLQLPAFKGAHRFIHVHRNVPGVLAHVNTVMSNNKANIVGQYLGTTADIGYAITDANTKHESRVIEDLNAIPDTIRVRTLY
ncbi:MAG TPA: phosphoglycerate dehydrogenase [Rhizomicrobium sp.]|jgi:D-3-phosphoglycerate dehydrogenase|nr:phosphoglycerate dehydrogenase [Rhizomicrobium sp.]